MCALFSTMFARNGTCLPRTTELTLTSVNSVRRGFSQNVLRRARARGVLRATRVCTAHADPRPQLSFSKTAAD